MQLADLPVELFQMVISYYVKSVGIVEAYACRVVCKTFYRFITTELFRDVPLSDFMLPYAPKLFWKILQKNLDLVLEWRSILPKDDCNPILPRLIDNVTRKVVAVSGQISSGEERDIRKKVSGIVVQHHSDALWLTTKRREEYQWVKQYVEDDVRHNALCVAVALHDRALIERLITDGASVWHKSNILGYPLRIAYDARRLDTFDVVLQTMLYTQAALSRAQRAHFMKRAIVAINNNAGDIRTSRPLRQMLSSLMAWYLEHIGKPVIKVRTCFAVWSMETANVHILQQIIDIPLPSNVKDRDTYYQRLYFASIPRSKVLQFLVSNQVLGINKGYRFGKGAVSAESVLLHAIKRGTISTVSCALELGAKADGPVDVKRNPGDFCLSRWPLGYAVDSKNLNLVKLLIDHGADPEFGTKFSKKASMCVVCALYPPSEFSGCGRRRLAAAFGSTPLTKVLREALEAKRQVDVYWHVPKGHEVCYSWADGV